MPLLRKISIFAPHSGDGPQDLPVTKSAVAAGVTSTATSAAYRLEIVHGDRTVTMSRGAAARDGAADRDPARSRASRGGRPAATGRASGCGHCSTWWTHLAGSDVFVTSLQERGAFRHSTLQGNFADDERTTLALMLNGEPLAIDHGYPARIIAPDRPGVLQTKWVTRLEVLT